MTQPNRREAARERAREDRAAALAGARRRRNGVVAGVVVAVLAVVVGLGVLVQAGRGSTSASSAVPGNLTQGGVLVGQASAPVTVTVYEDFQCPVCKQFEQTTGPALQQLVDSGKVKVIARPVAILDRASSTQYSTRALNAAACVVDAKPEAYPQFAHLLFEQQPEEGGAGLPDSALVAAAQQAGAGDISSCVADKTYEGWAARTTDQASQDGLTGTPYVLVDGTQLRSPTPDALTAAVAAA